MSGSSGKSWSASSSRVFCFFQIPGHHGRLRGKVDWILVVWILGPPRFDLLARQVVFLIPNIHLHDAVANGFSGMKRPCPLVHFTSVIEQPDMCQNGAQTVVGMGQIVLQRQGRA